MNDNRSRLLKLLAGLFGAFLLFYFLTHVFSKGKTVTIPTPVVVVQKPQSAEMTEYVTQTGTTVAFNAVNLVARVEGYLESIGFVDGTFVKKGQELFVIQPKPYMEQLIAAKASVSAQKAANDYSNSEYARQKRMYSQNATSQNNVEKWLANTQESAAEVDKAVANETNAAITYSYTHVTSPFAGRIGRHLVDVGNLVGHGEATELATVQQISPLYVYFNLNELDLIKLRNAARVAGFKPQDINKIPVYVSLQNQGGTEYKAKLDFVNTGLNASTGTMELRAILENKDYEFVPGLFVQVRIAVSKPTMQLTVPDTAVLYDQVGPYVLIVDKQNIVQMNRVTIGTLEKGMRGIAKGLNADDRVIVSGLQNATPGNAVDPQEPSSGKPAA